MAAALPNVLTVSRHHPSHLVAIKDFLSVREPNWIFVTEVTPAWTIGGGKARTPTILCGPNGCRETTRVCDLCGGFGIVTVEAAVASCAISGCTRADSPRSSWPAGWAWRGRELNDIECGRV